MAVVSYLPEDLAEPAELVAAIRARRGGKLLGLDRILLHSPPVAEGWGAFLGPVRTKLSLDPFLRELAMTIPSVIIGAAMEVRAHGKLLVDLGATQEQLDSLAQAATDNFPTQLFSPQQNIVIRLAGEMTRNGKPSRQAMEDARTVVDGDQGLVELVTTIAAYNMVARFVASLEID